MKRPAPGHQLVVRMPTEMVEAIKADGARNDRSMAQTVRRAIRVYLEGEANRAAEARAWARPEPEP